MLCVQDNLEILQKAQEHGLIKPEHFPLSFNNPTFNGTSRRIPPCTGGFLFKAGYELTEQQLGQVALGALETGDKEILSQIPNRFTAQARTKSVHPDVLDRALKMGFVVTDANIVTLAVDSKCTGLLPNIYVMKRLLKMKAVPRIDAAPYTTWNAFYTPTLRRTLQAYAALK